jgi:hypothetical protein
MTTRGRMRNKRAPKTNLPPPSKTLTRKSPFTLSKTAPNTGHIPRCSHPRSRRCTPARAACGRWPARRSGRPSSSRTRVWRPRRARPRHRRPGPGTPEKTRRRPPPSRRPWPGRRRPSGRRPPRPRRLGRAETGCASPASKWSGSTQTRWPGRPPRRRRAGPGVRARPGRRPTRPGGRWLSVRMEREGERDVRRRKEVLGAGEREVGARLRRSLIPRALTWVRRRRVRRRRGCQAHARQRGTAVARRRRADGPSCCWSAAQGVHVSFFFSSRVCLGQTHRARLRCFTAAIGAEKRTERNHTLTCPRPPCGGATPASAVTPPQT